MAAALIKEPHDGVCGPIFYVGDVSCIFNFNETLTCPILIESQQRGRRRHLGDRVATDESGCSLAARRED